MRKILETGIMIAAAYGFFGFVYPELCLIEDTCKIVIEQGTDGPDRDIGNVDLLREISSVPPEKIRIKSRLLEYLCEIE